MASGKERFEVLLEAIQSDVKAIAEGQGGLQRQIEEVRGELKAQITAVDKKHDTNFSALYDLLLGARKDIKSISADIQRVETKLDNHIKLPAHA